MGPRMDELRKKGFKVYKFDVDYHLRAANMLMRDNKQVPKVVIM